MPHSLLALVFLAILGMSQQTKYPKSLENSNGQTDTRKNSIHPTANGLCNGSSLGKSLAQTGCASAKGTKEPSQNGLANSNVFQREDSTNLLVKPRSETVFETTPRTRINQSSQSNEQNYQLTPKPLLNLSKQDEGCTGLILLESDIEVLPQETSALVLKLSKRNKFFEQYF